MGLFTMGLFKKDEEKDQPASEKKSTLVKKTPAGSKKPSPVAWTLVCSHPKLGGGLARVPIELSTPSVFCNCCRTQLILNKGKVFAEDCKADPHHELTAVY